MDSETGASRGKRPQNPPSKLTYSRMGSPEIMAPFVPVRKEAPKAPSVVGSTRSQRSEGSQVSLRAQLRTIDLDKEQAVEDIQRHYSPQIFSVQAEITRLTEDLKEREETFARQFPRGSNGEPPESSPSPDITRACDEITAIKREIRDASSRLELANKLRDDEIARVGREAEIKRKKLGILIEEEQEQDLDPEDLTRIAEFDQEEVDNEDDREYEDYGRNRSPSVDLVEDNDKRQHDQKKVNFDSKIYGGSESSTHSKREQQAYQMPPEAAQLVGAFSSALGNALGGDRLHISKYNGNPWEWSIFEREVQRARDSCAEDRVISKLNAALTGEAREAVFGLLDNPNSLQKILTTLQKRFGREEFILDSLVERVRACKSPSASDPESIVKFGTTVQNLVSRVVGMGKKSYLHNGLLLREMVSKLPVVIAEQWISWQEGYGIRDPSLEDFGEWMESKVDRTIPLCKALPSQPEKKFEKGRNGPKRGPGFIATTTSEADKRDKCEYCGKEKHSLGKCWAFEKKTAEEKKAFLKEQRLCFLCFKPKHSVRECTAKVTCDQDGCGKRHHTYFHLDNEEAKKIRQNPSNKSKKQEGSRKKKEPEPEPECSDEEGPQSTISAIMPTQVNPMSILPVQIKGPGGTIKVHAMLDSGANITVVDADLCDQLEIDGMSFTHNYTTADGSLHREKAKQVTFEIRGDYRGAEWHKVEDAVTMAEMGYTPYSMNVEEAKKRFPYLAKAGLKNLKDARPLILIGEDNPCLTAHRRILERNDDEPVAKRTRLGWVITGKSLRGSQGGSSINAIRQVTNEELHEMIKESFSLDNFGVVTRSDKGSIEDKKALAILESTSKQTGDRWECGLLWRDDSNSRGRSYNTAYTRMVSNEARMKKDPIYGKLFQTEMATLMKKEFLTKMTPEEAKREGKRTYYLPVFGVLNPNKPGKIRMVVDAAAKTDGESLNDSLLTGPDLIPNLQTILWNFRVHNVAVTGDVEDFFPRVKVIQEDMDSQRILYRTLEEAEQGIPFQVYRMVVLIFGATCSPTIAIFIKNKNADQYEIDFQEAVRATKQDMFVDDCLTGARDDQKAIDLVRDIIEVNMRGGFHVKKWTSDSPTVIAAIPEELRAEKVKDFASKSVIPTERVLGLWWNPEHNTFNFKVNFQRIKPAILEGETPTKREVCSVVMSLFDPLGMINNLKIKGLMIIQMIWKSGVDWGQKIPDSVHEEWKKFVEAIKVIEKVTIPRRYCLDIHLAKDVELHVFMDASEEAYAAVAYLRIVQESGVTVAFVSSKARVASLKKVTIPRMELLAAVMGVRLGDAICNELRVNISRRYFWSDAQTVLKWIQSETLRFKEFVGNRVGEIQDRSNPSEWRWVPTEENVADEATRIRKPVSLSPDSAWLNGPAFLKLKSNEWPTQKKREEDEEDVFTPAELKPGSVFSVACLGDNSGAGFSTDEGCGLGLGKTSFLPNPEDFSSYHRLLRATAGVLQAVEVFKGKLEKKPFSPPWTLENDTLPKQKLKKFLRKNLTSNISQELVKKAENLQIKEAQKAAFPLELKALQERKWGKQMKKSKLWTLSPFLDEEGIMRMKGRLQAASNLDEDGRHPIILSGKSAFVELLISQEHKNLAHQGHSTVFNNLRARFWIVDGRAAVRRVCEKCQTCLLRKAKPIMPEMGNLPHYRLAAGEPAFTHTGLDFCGPFEVTVGRRHEKRWICVFTCMVTRAVHFEVAYGLSTDEMLLVLSRFISERGRPRHLYSDNGTNFKGGKRVLKEEWEKIKWSQIAASGKLYPMEWHFHPPLGAHFSGVWERMVKSVKIVLKSTLHEKFPRDQVFLTVLKGAQNIINSRPITYTTGDPNDAEALTPNHFLRGANMVGPCIPGSYNAADEVLRLNWRRAQYLLDQFWGRWRKEYLPNLNKRMKWQLQTEPLVIGDIVLLVDENQPRNVWTKMFVTKTFPSPTDGQVRVVEVSTRDFDTKKIRTYKRTMDKVIPLGLRVANPWICSGSGGGDVKAD